MASGQIFAPIDAEVLGRAIFKLEHLEAEQAVPRADEVRPVFRALHGAIRENS